MPANGSPRQKDIPRHYIWAAYGFLVAVAWLVNYPGRLNPDSVDMLTQAGGFAPLNDWHAPTVTWLWSLLGPVAGQPAGALLIQALLMFIYPAIAVSGFTYRNSLTGAALLIAWGIFLAALIAVTGQVVKDIVLVGLILCFLAVLEFSAGKASKKRARVLLAALVAFIFLVRPTNFFMLAIAGVIWTCFAIHERSRRLKAALVIGAVCAASLFVSPVVNRAVLGAQNALAERSLIIFDVAGISTRVRQDLFAELPDWPAERISRPWECYTPRQWDPFAWGACERYSDLVKTVMQKNGTAFVVRWWMGAIVRHPIAYAEHRLSYSYELIRHMNPVASWELPYAVNIPARIGELHGAFTHGADMTGRLQLWIPSVAYLPFGWAAALVFTRPAAGLALVVCGLSLWRARGRAAKPADVVLVAASALGIGNFLTLMLFGISSEGRYLLVTFVCAAVSLQRLSHASSFVRSA